MSICESENREMEERLVRFFRGENLTPEEEWELEQWMQDAGHRQAYYRLRSLYGAVYAQRVGMKADVVKAWEAFEWRVRSGRRLGRWGVWAAAVAVLLGVAWFVALHWQAVEREGRMLAQAGEELSNRVVLTLSDGRQVALSEKAGNLEERGGARMRHDGQQLSYGGQDSVAAVVYNTLSTPRGAEYCVELADGTRVWLNAGSELRYPTAFRGATREVYLCGEAFFDVATRRECPFIVHASAFDVRVTGTEFNVRDYPREAASATLAEGRVEVMQGGRSAALVPGEEAITTADGIRVRKVNLDEAIAWRRNAFSFRERPLEELLSEIGRWYDVEVFYLNPSLKGLHFTAWFRRTESIGEVMRILEKTQKVKFELKGKTLIVKEY